MTTENTNPKLTLIVTEFSDGWEANAVNASGSVQQSTGLVDLTTMNTILARAKDMGTEIVHVQWCKDMKFEDLDDFTREMWF